MARTRQMWAQWFRKHTAVLVSQTSKNIWRGKSCVKWKIWNATLTQRCGYRYSCRQLHCAGWDFWWSCCTVPYVDWHLIFPLCLNFHTHIPTSFKLCRFLLFHSYHPNASYIFSASVYAPFTFFIHFFFTHILPQSQPIFDIFQTLVPLVLLRSRHFQAFFHIPRFSLHLMNAPMVRKVFYKCSSHALPRLKLDPLRMLCLLILKQRLRTIAVFFTNRNRLFLGCREALCLI